MRKHFPLIAALLMCMLCLALSGCASALRAPEAPIVGACIEAEAVAPSVPGLAWGERDGLFAQLPAGHIANPLLNKLNPELEYVVYSYELSLDEAVQDGNFSNLSKTSVQEGRYVGSANGWRILTCPAELAEYDAILGSSEKSAATAIKERRETTDEAFDEAFFREHRLLLVDMCTQGASELTAYPLEPEVEDGVVRMKIRCDSSGTYLTNAGQLFLIVIPADCTDAVVTLIPSASFGA